jgi:ectoine hydroxylase-related dioxygenase (phytanoyl-CoA dioxygenase family)
VQVFKDSLVQKELEEFGFAKFKIFNGDEVEEIKSHLANHDVPDKFGTGFNVVLDTDNLEYRESIHKFLVGKMESKVDMHCIDHEPFSTTYLIKEIGSGLVPAHQDWTYTDEETEPSLMCWVALVDTDINNGAMAFIPKSHNFFQFVRSFPFPIKESPVEKYKLELMPYMKVLDMKAGEIVFFNNKTIHGSFPNFSKKRRPAFCMSVKSKNKPALHYQKYFTGEKERISKFEVDNDFFVRYNNADLAEVAKAGLSLEGGTLLGNAEVEYPVYDWQEFQSLLTSNGIAHSEHLDSLLRKHLNKMHFKNEKIQSDFETDGYCKIPLLSQEDVAKCLKFAEEHILDQPIDNTDYGMYVSLDEEKGKKYKITEFVKSVVAPKLHDHIVDFQIHLGGYLIKAPDKTTYTFPHQDWTFVDNETDAVSATIWISLYDIGPENGTLGFLKGSHKKLNHTIGSPSPAVMTPAQGMETEIFRKLTFESVKAGEALVFNNKTIHAALPNSSDIYRTAIGIGITPKNSSLYHYFLDPSDPSKFLKIKVNEDFYMTYNNGDLYKLYTEGKVPELGEIVGKVDNGVRSFPTKADMEHFLSSFEDSGYSLDLGKHFGNQTTDQNDTQSGIEVEDVENALEDSRTFFQTYTPKNIYREALYRMGFLKG